jgi:hypothetical protein
MDSLTDLQADAHPTLKRLLAYWERQRAGRKLPSRRDIDPADIRYALGFICIADIERGPPLRFRFRLDGTIQARYFGVDMTGWYLDEFPDPEYRVSAQAAFEEAAAAARPLYHRRNMEKDGRLYRYEVLYLPLGGDGETVDMLLVTIIPG